MTSNIYSQAQEYDGLFGPLGSGEELDFYARQVARYGQPVLELCCGTGRLTVPLAENHIEMVGIDIAETMLTVAREKAASRGLQIPFVQADISDFSLEERFGLIFIPCNSLCHLYRFEQIVRCFACVREHLAPGGRFVIDVFNPSLEILLRDPGRRYPVGEFPDAAGTRVVITENNRYDTATQINHILWYYARGDQPEEPHALDMRQFFPQELDALLACHGFSIEAKYGDFAETPFASESIKQLVVCRATS